jgi:RND family efflux transporter MFP subunit
MLTLLAVAVGAVVFWGIDTRIKTAAGVSRETLEMAVPAVSVIHPKRGAPADEVVLPGNIQAFTEAPIYARTSGYLKQWHTDIGARVKAGQLLAEIETPEVDKQLDQARADLATAEANYRLAESTAARWQNLLKTDSVSRQETDEKLGDFAAKKTIVDSTRSNVKRLEDLQSFQKIYAPFDGVITARNTDVGQLIGSGSIAQAKELFHLAATNKLRVFVSVPQIYSRSAIPGVTAELTLSEFPGRRFAGKLARTSEAIDAASRTLLAEVDVDNAQGQLLPGAYAEVHLKFPSKTGVLILPVNTLIFRSEGLQVGVIRDGDKAELVPIRMGRDYGTEVEIVAGISEKDSVIVNPPDSITSGTLVRVSK